MRNFLKTVTLLALGFFWANQTTARAQELILKPGSSPLVNITLQFQTGSAYDPQGLEGCATFVATSLTEGATKKHSHDQLLQLLYPWAVSVGATTDKETTTFYASVHKDNLEKFTPLLVEMITEPDFSKDLKRLRTNLKNYISQDLRQNNEEELGKEALYLNLYPPSHPYGHYNMGSLSGLQAIDEDSLQSFYKAQFTRKNFVLGVAGDYPQGFPEKLRDELLARLPASPAMPHNLATKLSLPSPTTPNGRQVTIIDKDTRAVAMSLGFPIQVTRSHPDWVALNLVRSYLGEHRSSNSYLYQRLREARGLNYGDYAYIEYFPFGMYLSQPNPYYARSQQIFQVWIRPVQPETAIFTLRATLYELEKLIKNGMTSADFEATRSFLVKNTPLLVASPARSLGYDFDSKFYGVGPYAQTVRDELAKLSLEQVNAAIKRHLQANNIEILLVANAADTLKGKLITGLPSPIEYNSPKPDEILTEDKTIESYPLNLEEIKVVPLEKIFY